MFLIGPILFLYYEESLVSSNLNSNLFRFHCVRPTVHTLHTSEMIPAHNVVHTTAMAMVTKNTTFDTVAACVKQVEAGMMRTYSSLLKSINV